MLTPKDILQAAIYIAEDLLKRGSKRTYKSNKNLNHTFSFTSLHFLYNKESLYDGYAGIGLFFLALYKQTKNERYLSASKQVAHELITYCQEHPTQNYTFFTGRGGVIYLLTQLFEVDYDSYYAKMAVDLLLPKHYIHQLKLLSMHNLMTGIAGSLLAGLHVHQQTENKRVLSFIEQSAQQLITDFHIFEKGIYWGNSHQQIQPLCGFAHGNAGIAWILLELGFYLDNQVFIQLAEQAFAYERYHFSKQQKNYPDFKKSMYAHTAYDAFKQEYLKKNYSFFTQAIYTNKWYSGAAGIGLSRLRAFQLLHRPVYYKELMHCIQTTIETDVDTYQNRPFYLYHGSGGSVDLLLEAYLVLQEQKYLDYAQQVAYQSITFNHRQTKIKKNEGLLIGEAGLGYFYLRAFNPYITPSILCPKLSKEAALIVESDQYPNLTIFEAEVRTKAIEKVYPRTFKVTNQLYTDNVIDYLSESVTEDNWLMSFHNFVNQLLAEAEFSGLDQQLIADVFCLEQIKQQLQNNISSYALLHIAQVVQKERLLQYVEKGQGKLEAQQVQIHSAAVFHTTKWNWQEKTQAWVLAAPDAKQYTFILAPNMNGGLEVLLTNFMEEVLQVFTQSKFICDAVREIQNGLQDQLIEIDDLEMKILLQIKQFLELGILVFVLE